MNRVFAVLAGSILSWIVMSAPPAAAADFTMCKDIRKGDVAACKTRVASACTEGDDWQRHNCEGRIGPSFDECNGPGFTKAVATAKDITDDARHSDMPENPSSAELQPWIGRAKRIEAEVAEYARLAGEWKPCGEGPFSDDDGESVRHAVANYQRQYRSEIDYVLENSNRQMKSEGVDKEAGKPGFEMGSMWKEKIATLQELSSKVPISWRYKEAELKSALARSDANGKALAGWADAQIAATSCPAGKAVGGSFLSTLRREFASDRNVKRRVFRQTAARYVSRDGLVSRDNVPVALCTEWARKAHPCETTNVTIYREKPPGGAWTAWRLAIGGGEEFNCKKF